MAEPMTDAAELLAELQAADVKLWIENGRVRFRAPFGRPVTVPQLLAIKHHDAELVALLRSGALLEQATGEPP